MTATAERPAPAQPAVDKRAGSDPLAAADNTVAIVTGTVAAGVLLTLLPLRSIFTDWSWLTAGIGCALPYLAVVLLLRTHGAPRWWHSVLGLLAAVLVTLWVFVPQHLGYGVLPTPSSIGDVGQLIDGARTALRDEHAPLASTGPLRLITTGAILLLVLLTDVLGVLLQRPLLAAAPLLEVLAVASATSSRPAHPVWFAAAAAGFLLILVSGTRLQDRSWGPSVDGSAGRLGGARRMAVTGIVAALVGPLLLPSVSVNLLARATHHDGGTGPGGSGQVELRTAADLSGSLRRANPVELLRVSVAPGDTPFYIRQTVLDRFTDTGWLPTIGGGSSDGRTPLLQGEYPIAPGSVNGSGGDVGAYTVINARFQIVNLGGRGLPLFANPNQLTGVTDGVWDERTASVAGPTIKRNLSYSERAYQPKPSVQQLRAAPDWTPTGDATLNDRYLSLPRMPAEVSQLASRLTAALSSSYDKARAISDYFTNGKNGFIYSLDAPPADGRAAIVTFLDKKQGFCQQYAAAAAALMRQVGLPSRVVLGYSHRSPNDRGNFSVTTSDAHAWVEVYFSGIGWIAFDPTPLAGGDAARAVGLPWAPHPNTGGIVGNEIPTASTSASNRAPERASAAGSLASLGNGAASGFDWTTLLVAIGVLLFALVILLGPQSVRRRQRRRRLADARATGSPEPLWQELAASAADRDALWPDTITVAQVPAWLHQHGVDERGTAAVSAVADRVAVDRFSPRRSAALGEEFVVGLDQAMRRWARREERRQRVLSWWLPRSLISRSERWRR
jgi:hypothetical protein